ncbi:SDR family oxidoreductase [Sphingomonas lutea]|uniref:UDP-glucuronate decarboxylase n=1 Tax=Sphingomonas lutea TaxID=1045317 RepID=A0A7G9SH40_9SPHN|nr:UDP-glucuronic acid decarboxylase family protein [Sphingomonas lutea]QNN67165.1 SDR family oxidoreductase [Sphingomonas lutea]
MTKWNDQTVVVTGGAGFIGANLCARLLDGGAQVICIDNLQTGRLENLRDFAHHDRFEFIQHDVIDPLPRLRLPARSRICRVYHLAGAASPPHYQADPEHTLLTAVLGTRNMLSLSEQSGARFFLASTSEVYGDPEVHPQHEDYRGSVNCTGPRACYDEGKRSAETLAFDFYRARRADVRVARIFNTYGPKMRSDDGRVVSNIVCQALSGQDITIYGDGSQTRSFCFVDDLIEGLTRLMESDRAAGMPVNLGNPNELSVRQLVDLVVDKTSTTSRITFKDLPEDDPRRRRPDISRAQEFLDWTPQVTLDHGLDATVAWFQAEQHRAAAPLYADAPLIAAAE